MAFPTFQYQNMLAVQRFANALYDVQVGSETMEQVLSDISSSGGVDAVFNAYYDYSYGSMSDADVAAVVATNLGVNSDAEAYIANALTSAGANKGAVLGDLLELFSTLESDPVFGAAATAWNAEVAVAMDYDGEADVVAGTEEPAPDFYLLTENRDIMTGSSAADEFLADVTQTGGLQVNTLGTGDTLQGGTGADELNAQLLAAATFQNVGNGNDDATSMAVQPRLNSIETIKLEAINNDYDLDNDSGDNSYVHFNAKNVEGHDEIWSWHSDANLVIQDLTTMDSDGVMRPVSSLTVGMGYTGSDDDFWDESDFYVFFDQDYLNPEVDVSGTSSVAYKVMNQDAYDDINGADVDGYGGYLDGVYFDTLQFDLEVGGVDLGTVDLTQFLAENELGAVIQTEQDVVDVLNAAVADGSIVAATGLPVLANLEFEASGTFLDPDDRLGTTIIARLPAYDPETGDEIVLGVEDTDAQLNDSEGGLPGDNRYDEAVDDLIVQTDEELRINVALEKVGRDADGGDLVIGSMDKDMSNSWDGGENGIPIFDVTVYGDEDKPSSVDELRSTNNVLKEVNISTDADQTDTYAGLSIDWLKDVQTVDASDFMGDLSINAGLGTEVTAKYFTLTDDASDETDDNVQFDYTLGQGDDYLDLEITAANLEAVGTTTFEDFQLEINAGEGDDYVVFNIYGEDDLAENDESNWYLNHMDNADIEINGDDGDDTIWTPGAGDLDINGGDGDDTIYADNTAGEDVKPNSDSDFAKWVINATNTDLTDLDGAGRGARSILYDATLTVTFAAANETEEAGITQPDAAEYSNGWESSVTITTDYIGNQNTVNQAIKAAINNDPVLNKLLLAEDGPADTLVITALIDGDFTDEDLFFDIEATDFSDLSVGLQDVLQDQYEDLQNNSTVTLNQGILDQYADDFAADINGGNIAVLAQNGDSSIFESDNTINAGSGDDVVVMGTGADSNDTLLFTGYGNDSVTVVNFDDEDDSPSEDYLDFSAYLTDLTSASGSTTSQQAVPEFETIESGVSEDASASEVIFFNGFASAAGESWADMTAADFLLAIQDDTDSDSYGNIVDGSSDVVNQANLVGTTQNHIFLVENDRNDGEYKVFHVTSDTDDGEFDGADLVGTVDFGATYDNEDNYVNGVGGDDGGELNIIGTAGAETFNSNVGAETITGNGGNDVFSYTAANQFGDTITDFNAGDEIHLDVLNEETNTVTVTATAAVPLTATVGVTDSNTATATVTADEVTGLWNSLYTISTVTATATASAQQTGPGSTTATDTATATAAGSFRLLVGDGAAPGNTAYTGFTTITTTGTLGAASVLDNNGAGFASLTDLLSALSGVTVGANTGLFLAYGVVNNGGDGQLYAITVSNAAGTTLSATDVSGANAQLMVTLQGVTDIAAGDIVLV